MTIKQLIARLNALEKTGVKKKVKCASDEEWNTVYKEINMQVDMDTNCIVIYGLSGSEEAT